MKNSILTKVVVLCLFLSMVLIGQAKAQNTSEYALLVAIEQAQAAAIAQPHIKTKLVVWDALTNGAISSNTQQVQFGVFITNDSPNTYAQLTVQSNNLYVENRVAGSLQDKYTSIAGFLNNSPVLPYSSKFYYLGGALTLKNVTTTKAIIAHADLSIVPMVPDPGKAGAFLSYPVSTSVEGLIYDPSNVDLIPTIVNNQSNQSTALTSVNTTANQILQDVAPTQQCKTVTLTVRGPGGAGQVCGDGGVAKVNPQAVCALYGYSGGTMKSQNFSNGPYGNDFQLATSPVGSFPITVNGHVALWQMTPACESWAAVSCQQC